MHPDIFMLAILVPGAFCGSVVSELSDGQPVAPIPTSAVQSSGSAASTQTHTVYATMTTTSKLEPLTVSESFKNSGCSGMIPVSTYQPSGQPHLTTTLAGSTAPESATQSVIKSTYAVVSPSPHSGTAVASPYGGSGYPTASPASNTTVSAVSSSAGASSTYKVTETSTTASPKTGSAAITVEPAIGLVFAGFIVLGLI